MTLGRPWYPADVMAKDWRARIAQVKRALEQDQLKCAATSRGRYGGSERSTL